MRTLIPFVICLALLPQLGAEDKPADKAAGTAKAGTAGIVNVETVKQFDELIAKSKDGDGIVVVDFHADWCGPCKQLAPELEALVKDNPKKLSVIKVNVDKAPDLAKRFNVSSIPLLVRFEKGVEVSREVGYQDKGALRKWLDLK
jgi:thioredoxin